MPRSLLFACQWINLALRGLEELYGKRYECHDQASDILTRLKASKMEDIFQNGLHEFLGAFMADNNALSKNIAHTFNFP